LTRISRRLVYEAPFVFAALGLIAAGTTAYSFVRLTSDGQTGIRWAAMPVRYVIHASGSDDETGDQRDDAAIRLAMDTWSSVDGSSVRLVEDTGPARNMTKRHANDGVNLIFFDETNETKLPSTVIAITPVFFDTAGNILDADIVFNGADFHFSTSLAPGTYDIQDIATHEIGHFLGLDHTGVYGATLIPFAFPAETRLRSLAEDDRAGVRTIYATGRNGALTGAVMIEGPSGPVGVNGAHVVAANATTGETAASALTLGNGVFTIDGLRPGSYRVYVEPMDGPTQDANLQRDGLATSFTTTFAGGVSTPSVFAVGDGQTVAVGQLFVQSRSGFNLTGVQNGNAQVLRGTTATIALTGTGLQNGQQVEVPGPGVRLSDGGNSGKLFSASTSGALFTIAVDANATPGIRDVYVYRGSGGAKEMVALPGGIEIRASAPSVTGCVPNSGVAAGGERVDVNGSNFQPGARVLFGDAAIDQDPLTPENVQFVSDTKLSVVTPKGAVGVVDVTVINPDGQQAVLRGGYAYTGQPEITSISPAQGPTAGGVPVTIFGSQFASGASVLFRASPATSVVVSNQGQRLDCVTPAGLAGAVDVTVQNPGATGGTVTLANGYTYIDPRIDSVSPAFGSTSGGTIVTMAGDGFSPAMVVQFGAKSATSFQFISQTSVRASAPAAPAGTVDVTVIARDGAADTARGAFTYVPGTDPSVVSISPASGPATGGSSVVIAGSNFESGATVRIGGAAATDVVVVSATEIQAVAPPGVAGAQDVTVENPSHLSGTLYGGYTYFAPAVTAGSSGGGGGGGGCTAAPAQGGAAGAAAMLPYLLAAAAIATIRRRVVRRPESALARVRAERG
jgi:hypothetical protein